MKDENCEEVTYTVPYISRITEGDDKTNDTDGTETSTGTGSPSVHPVFVHGLLFFVFLSKTCQYK